MKPYLFILIFSFISSLLIAQTSTDVDEVKLLGQRHVTLKKMKGSPFLFSDWKKGTVVLKNGDVKRGVLLKYDLLNDELLTMHKDFSSVIKIDKAIVMSFTIWNKNEEWMFEQRNLNDGAIDNCYLRVLHKGVVELLCRYWVSIAKVSPYGDLDGRLKNQEYVAQQRYYCHEAASEYCSIRLNRKAFLRRIDKSEKGVVRQSVKSIKVKGEKEIQYFISLLKLLESQNIQLHL